jgi:hypothetical protein
MKTELITSGSEQAPTGAQMLTFTLQVLDLTLFNSNGDCPRDAYGG